MSKSLTSLLTNQLAWFLKQYREIQELRDKLGEYRIEKIQEKEDGSIVLKINIVGKNVIFVATPKELAASDEMLDRFSRRDVRAIIYLACHGMEKPTNKLLSYDFCEETNDLIFNVEDVKNQEVVKLNAAQLSANKELMKNLNAEDAFLVGYTIANEKEKHIAKEITRIKQAFLAKYKIISSFFCKTFSRMIFSLYKKDDGSAIQKTAEQIIQDKEIQSGLSVEDNIAIAYVAGMEHTEQTKNAQKQLKDGKKHA